MTRLSLSRIEESYRIIDQVFLNTPQYSCPHLSNALGCRVILKVETLNPIRCFKGRGTETVLARLGANDGPKSVVCASAGNLGQALAYCGKKRGFEVTVAASAAANPLKIQRMKALGATVILVEGQIEEALEAAIAHSRETGAFLVEDSKNIDTCEGAGTIGLELAKLPFIFDSILISLGAGAMATGIGLALKSYSPRTKVLSVQPQNAPALTRSYFAGEVVDSGPPRTIADGVAGRYTIPEVLADMLEIVDDALLVEEKSIVEAMRLLYKCCGLVVEPAAALGVASILENPNRFRGQTVATVLCGSNVAPEDFAKWAGF
ncbi:pyridoxal-phosphate dependent enzyme [Jiella sp. MQZ13P-4]|uniref:Pyridoxal-phosphate dependent enzyme n=2 Tax=Jiella sonneratiae TaxID=2816856 RepID=A0ABS3J4R3_9HYPH|nr:pyridoxal-phosphate dependent enzyme [Jiella sonneratiae]MBO0904651.1 pyridoxal-phosphate dependent enzyme [Jiella sonneratiae]